MVAQWRSLADFYTLRNWKKPVDLYSYSRFSKGFAAHPWKNVSQYVSINKLLVWYRTGRKHRLRKNDFLVNMECLFSYLSFSLKAFFFFLLQGSSEAEPVLQEEEAPALTAPPTGALHLPHQLQWHPAGLAAPCPAMPAPGCVQSERKPRDGKGKNRPHREEHIHPLFM